MPRKPKNPNRGLRWGGGSVRRRGDRWEARWWDGEVHRSKSFATSDAAWDHLIDRERGRARTYADTMTVREMVGQMLERAEGRLADGSIYGYGKQAELVIFPSLGSRRAAELGPFDIQRWVDSLKGRYRPGSIRFALAILSSAFTEARRLQLVPENPCSGVRRPANPRRTPVVWTVDEARRVLAAVDPDPIYGALYLVALVTGMRPGELAALRWEDVDLDRGLILVRATIAHARSGEFVIQPATKGKEPRYVTIGPAVIDRLHRHRATQAGRQHCAASWEDLGIVFDRGDGRWIHNAMWNGFNRRLCARVGVPVITPHGLRHTSATFDLDANTHGKIVSERLGHRDPGFTMRFYQHVRQPLMLAASNALSEQVLGATVRSVVRTTPRNRPKPQRSSRVRQRR